MRHRSIRPSPCNEVIVVVPACNEASTIGPCIASIDAAARRLRVPVALSLAADSCSDDTVERASAVPLERVRLTVVEGRWGRAGAARAAAAAHALDRPLDLASVWLANTDADCVVPPTWLSTQIALGRTAAAVAGVVSLDDGASPRLRRAFSESYLTNGEEHVHIHGANLGLRADVYVAVGGWCSETVVGEDHLLWRAVRQRGIPVVQTTALTVVTSARTVGRSVGGFAADLALLDAPPGRVPREGPCPPVPGLPELVSVEAP